MDEIKLFNSASEREKVENLAELYSIIMCIEHLEKAYIRDSVDVSEYK